MTKTIFRLMQVLSLGVFAAAGAGVFPMPAEAVDGCADGAPVVYVTVRNVEADQGEIVADLHGDDPTLFLKKGGKLSRTRVPAQSGQVSFCIPVERPGRYALAVYHDVNGNRKLDQNFVGLPKEPFGLSNNPRILMRAPKLDETAFEVADDGTEVEVILNR